MVLAPSPVHFASFTRLFLVFSSVPLVYESVFMPVPHDIDYFVMFWNLKIMASISSLEYVELIGWRARLMSMRMWVRSLASLTCSTGCRCGSDLALLGLWCRLAAVAPIWLLGQELTYAAGVALKKKKKKKEIFLFYSMRFPVNFTMIFFFYCKNCLWGCCSWGLGRLDLIPAQEFHVPQGSQKEKKIVLEILTDIPLNLYHIFSHMVILF